MTEQPPRPQTIHNALGSGTPVPGTGVPSRQFIGQVRNLNGLFCVYRVSDADNYFLERKQNKLKKLVGELRT